MNYNSYETKQKKSHIFAKKKVQALFTKCKYYANHKQIKSMNINDVDVKKWKSHNCVKQGPN